MASDSIVYGWRGAIRVFLLLLLPLLILTGGIGYYSYLHHFSDRFELVKQKESGLVKLGHNVIADVFYPVISDLQAIASLTEMHMDFQHREALKEDMVAFSMNKQFYEQVRYLDQTGMEVIRINYHDGDATLVPDDKLQNKGARYYFQETAKLRRGEVYLSPFDLNVEHGKIEIPFKPVIRFAMPVFDADRKFRGVVILNYLGQHLLDRFQNTHKQSISDVMLLNADGYWLHANDLSKTFGFMLPGREHVSFAQDYPQVWQQMKALEYGQTLTEQGLFSFETLYPKSEAERIGMVWSSEKSHTDINESQPYLWRVVSFMDQSRIETIRNECRQDAVELMLIIFITGSILLWFVSLAHTLRQSAQGNKMKAAIQDAAMDCIITCDEQGLIQDVNPAAEREFGFRLEEAIGEPCERYIQTASGKLVPTSEHQFIECTGCRVDGSTFQAEMTLSKVNYADISGFACFLRNISEQKRILEEFRKLFHAVEQMQESLVLTDIHGVIEYVNPAFTRITGYAAEEAIGQNPSMLKSGEHDDSFYRGMWRTLTLGRVWHGKIIDKRKDGSLFSARLSISPVSNSTGEITHYVGIEEDMTEQEALENKFRQAQKMEAIGTLVGGMAHDFNNVLTGITGQLFLARMQAQDAGENTIAKSIEEAEHLGFHAADMIRQLLTFSRKGKVDMVQFDLRVFIGEAIKMAKAIVPESVHLGYNFEKGDMVIMGDTTQIQQMLFNLLINASHAVADNDKPEINVAVQRFTADVNFAKRYDVAEHSRYVRLSVSDNGCGIEEDQLGNIFEPFYTTKEAGKGTGLGLAMLYGSIHSHQGLVDVESQVGKGTTFHLYFPLQEMIIFHHEEALEEVNEGYGELILLVDDEESVLVVTKLILNQLGYRCLTALHGQQALALYEEHKQEIVMMISDVVMPKMGGIEAAMLIHKMNPQLPVIFASGYQRGVGMETGLPTTLNYTFICKPYSVSELSKIITEYVTNPDYS